MESILSYVITALSNSFSLTAAELVDILPEATLAFFIVIIGLLIASALYYTTVRTLELFAIDKLADKTPLRRLLRVVGIHKSVSAIVGSLVFWLCIMVTLVVVADILHLQQVSVALQIILLYIPQLIAAILLLVFGLLLARFLETLLKNTIGVSHVHFGSIVGKIVYILVLVFIVPIVFEQLGLELTFLTTNIIILLAVLSLVAGIAVVLASRILFAQWLACQQLRSELTIGGTVKIASHQGVIRGFTQTGVIVHDKGTNFVIPAQDFLINVYSVSAPIE